MSIEVTVIGNLTKDPELRTTNNGNKVANFTLAVSERKFNKASGQYEDGVPIYFNCHAWDRWRKALASNIASSVSKGMRVIVQGVLSQDVYTAKDGSTRKSVDITVISLGVDLSFSSIADVGRSAGAASAVGAGFDAADDPWISAGEPQF